MIIHCTDRQALFRRLDQEALEAAAGLLQVMGSTQRATFELGLRAAPLFFGYALFIAEQSLTDCVGRLFFFTREGELFHRVFARVFPGERLGHGSPPPAYILEVSRLATFSASLRSLSIKEMMRLWSLYSSQSMFALARSLGVEPAALEIACARHGIALEEGIIHPWQDERVKELFSDDEFKGILTDKIKADRSAALAYLESRGMVDDGSSIGIVDIGWRGTIQDNLALIFPCNRFVGYYLGLQRFLNVQPQNCLKHAYGPNANLGLGFTHLLDAVSPMEMLCSSPHGSVMGYGFDSDGRPSAKRLTEPSETAIYEDTVRHFQDGVLFACEHWAHAREHHKIRSAELRELACDAWGGLITKPKRQISEAYAKLNHNDVFGVGLFVDKRQVPSPIKILRGLISSRDRREVILYIKQTQWTSGLWHRRDLGLVHRAILVAILSTGRAYKRARMWVQHHWPDRHRLSG
ncbi:hypothetical protein G3480_24300 [Thiorhodococcus mannitoliphagus]|uniref:Uncharacterized protein n=1 Tax=Thiorhodococcus mannitoliphagus TaxID=329406 RepID=A0A6P1E2S4_9GAMM|nr:hypothetical protein [Thiorhodococcus mannitoliphagus]NEX23376.1 hypothetical protein [Thiorhodococcus mannitoliphagus]